MVLKKAMIKGVLALVICVLASAGSVQARANTFEEHLEENKNYRSRYENASLSQQEKMRARWAKRHEFDMKREEDRKMRWAKDKEKKIAGIEKRRMEWEKLSAVEKRARIRAKRAGR